MTNPVVQMETTKGTIKVEINAAQAPKSAANFLDLVNKGFYNGLSFHRYEPGFVIQGGCPRGTGTGGYTENGKERRIELEVSKDLKHTKGVIAMARANDPNSASSQFYFTLEAAPFLDMQYAVFGKVIEGMDAVSQLRAGDQMTKVHELTAAKH
ncbi:MAG TPA: peptidylprolyl isomerase [Trichormus sp.]